MVAVGFDFITAASTILLGSTVNPFVVSSSVDALKTSGITIDQTLIIIVGAISWLACYAVGAFHVMRYVKKVKANKAASLLTAEEWKAVKEEYGGEKRRRMRASPSPRVRRSSWCCLPSPLW